MKKIFTGVLILGLLLLIRNLAISLGSILRNARAAEALKEKLVAKKRENQFLSQRLYIVQKNEFIAQEARQKLGLVKKGEYIIIAPPPPQKAETKSVPEDANWEKWLKLFL